MKNPKIEPKYRVSKQHANGLNETNTEDEMENLSQEMNDLYQEEENCGTEICLPTIK